ncbi:hypothetical protein M271_50330 [Streptomyces rapamycinicus NRRL 5491]|uniref:Uncharacterized protein n=2 Tax=Streptomyces rapamycinicus TaxID=1226757 RepID=A0A0A0NVC8_STRRN|nr:hypothetical protein M271_50330 [Streptomyces rapamycinicus NRRL 5491]MBB4787393.1 hypothetical protein [Streptomyces rapamycinicus]RLV71739.1 hypothetical protein D3C57_144470 [Streptomyces rapamycinicus NRRL 5491]
MTVPVNDLGISSPGRIHPRVDQIGSGLDVWAVRTGPAGGAAQRARLRAAGFHRMAARMIPDAPAADVERLAQWITCSSTSTTSRTKAPWAAPRRR